MPVVEVHVRDSLARTGKTYLEVHEWLDKDEAKKAERHDITRMVKHAEYVKGVWGEEAAQEYVKHLHDDIKKRMAHIQDEVAKQMADTLVYFGIR